MGKNLAKTQWQIFISTGIKAILSGLILSFTINGALIFLTKIYPLFSMQDFKLYVNVSPVYLGFIGFIIIISFRIFKKLFLWRIGATIIFMGFSNFLIHIYLLLGNK